jgi:hypothetical protein
MKKVNVLFAVFLMSILSFGLYASQKISVTVKSDYKKVSALGFSVNGSSHGGLGNSYSSKGPKDMTYSFGYREGLIFSKDVSCGTLFLDKDSIVLLKSDGNSCNAELA